MSGRKRTISVMSGESNVTETVRTNTQASQIPDKLIKEEEVEVGSVRLIFIVYLFRPLCFCFR